MKYILVVPIGEKFEEVLNLFEVDRIIFLTQDESNVEVKSKLPYEIIKIDNLWEDTFRVMSEIKGNVLVYPRTTTGDFRGVVTAAAFVNGFKVLDKKNDEIILLPPYKFTYFSNITEKKKEIVELLYAADNHELSLESIGQLTNMSLPLISYHINGNVKSQGLKELGLVGAREEKGRSYIHLSTLGVILLKGYIGENEDDKYMKK